MADANHPVLFLLLATVLWLAVSLVMAYLGGWQTLATYYRAPGPFHGKQWHFSSASIRLVTYHNCLTLGANTQGVFISVWLPFRFRHAPLFVPWSEIDSVERCSKTVRPTVRFHFRRTPSATLGISLELARAMISETHGRPLPLGASTLLEPVVRLGETAR